MGVMLPGPGQMERVLGTSPRRCRRHRAAACMPPLPHCHPTAAPPQSPHPIALLLLPCPLLLRRCHLAVAAALTCRTIERRVRRVVWQVWLVERIVLGGAAVNWCELV